MEQLWEDTQHRLRNTADNNIQKWRQKEMKDNGYWNSGEAVKKKDKRMIPSYNVAGVASESVAPNSLVCDAHELVWTLGWTVVQITATVLLNWPNMCSL